MTTEPGHSPYKSKSGFQRVFRAWGYSMQGLRAGLKHEAAFRQETALAIVLIPAAFWLGRNMLEVLLLLTVLVLVLVVELLNSAVEAVCDALTVETHPLIGRAKDLGSAAVMMMLIFAALVWLTVLVNRVFL
jgi:diacylglycerol kinase (ATP)